MIATSIAVSAAYTLVATVAFVAGYRIAARSERTLTLYVMVASVLRMLSAAAVVLVYLFIVKDRDARVSFIIIFSVFYLLMLISDAVFFIRSQKTKQKQTK